MSETAGVGHNSDTVLNGAAQGQLKSILERLERIDDEKIELQEQAKEVLAEAKGNGFSPPIIRALFNLRKKRMKNKGKFAEDKALLELYAHAVGDMDLVS